LKIGTTNKNTPLVIYLEGKTYITPREEKEEYERDIRDIKSNIHRILTKGLKDNKYFEPKYILDFQIANSGIKMNKKSFLTFEFLLRQKNTPLLKLREIKEKNETFINETLNLIKETIRNRGFNITKTKNVLVENAVFLYK